MGWVGWVGWFGVGFGGWFGCFGLGSFLKGLLKGVIFNGFVFSSCGQGWSSATVDELVFTLHLEMVWEDEEVDPFSQRKFSSSFRPLFGQET